MIRTLSIQNYAIIEQIEIHFSNKLTIITGETGAGKSIMLGALGLIMGQRAETKVLYNQNAKCIVEGVFDIGHYDLKDFFEEHDLDYEVETVIRREILPSGRTRAFVNDTPVRLGVLKDLTTALIDLHRQFDTQDISDPEFQVMVIDALAENKALQKDYKTKYRQYISNKRKLAKLTAESKKAKQEVDFYQFQYNELLEAELENGEVARLEQEQKTLNNAEDIKRILGSTAYYVNDDENCITGQLNELLTQISSLAEFHSKLPKLTEKFEGTILELEELANELQAVGEETEYDPERLEEVGARLNQLYTLQTKHSVNSDEELLEIQENLAQRIKGYSDMDEEIESLEKAIDQQESALWKLGKQISTRRSKVIKGFEENIQRLLVQLSMKHAILKVDLQASKELLPAGTDHLKFLFSPNKGSRFEDIKGVASGGELSRLALTIKSLVASAIPLPTLIFDEIDSGVSGEVALQMGVILKALSAEHQVVSITHSPQIAAKADSHYFVHKKVLDDRTITNIRPLLEEERILEIAKMLSGNPPSEFAKQNARELLATAKITTIQS